MYALKRKLELTEEQNILIYNKVLALPRQERLIIHLYFWEQYSHIQIARDLRLSLDDISKIIQSAMLKLRGELFKQWGD